MQMHYNDIPMIMDTYALIGSGANTFDNNVYTR